MDVDRYPGPPSEQTACLTMDLERSFDVGSAAVEGQVFDRLDDYIDRLQYRDVPVSMFVVGRTVEERPEMIRRLDSALDVEFHLHSYSHDMSGETDTAWEIEQGLDAFESVIGREPTGYRAPRYIATAEDLEALSDADFAFDSSVCPSYRPGVYNHLDKPTKPFYPAVSPDLLEIPISVHPQLRVPVTQSWLRLFGSPYLRLLEHTSLPNLVVYNSHLHDYYRTQAHDMLSPVKKRLFCRNLEDSLALFDRFLDMLEERCYRFRTLGDVASMLSEPVASSSTASESR